MRRKQLVLIVMSIAFTIISILPAQADEDQPEFGLSQQEIEAYVLPEFDQLTVDEGLLYDRRYQQVNNAVDIFDAPNGNYLRTLDPGFNFLTVLQVREDGWTEINRGEWARSENLADTNYIVSHFTGIFLPEEMPEYTVAWMLINAYPSRVPGGNPDESNPLLYRYTMVHLFATVDIDGWRWYQIGVDQWVHQTYVGKVVPINRPEDVTTDKWVAVDLYEQVLIVYQGDRPIFATLIATGLPRWPTFEGTFNIYYRRVRHTMSWGTVGDDYYFLEEVPWTMFFDEGRALHGAYWHDGFGYRRSHGCVNMTITDAYWLYNWIAEDFDSLNSPDIEVGPAVYVYSSDTYVE